MKNNCIQYSILSLMFTLALGCSSSPAIKKQAYAKLNNQKTYEYEFLSVWKALEETLRNFKIIKKDPDELNSVEIQKITYGTLETDWIYTQSRDKYQEYLINGSPRKIYLQSRLKYQIELQKGLGGVTVTVNPQEEIERLNSDGTSAGYEKTQAPDSLRAHDLLEKLTTAILAGPPLP